MRNQIIREMSAVSHRNVAHPITQHNLQKLVNSVTERAVEQLLHTLIHSKESVIETELGDIYTVSGLREQAPMCGDRVHYPMTFDLLVSEPDEMGRLHIDAVFEIQQPENKR